MKILTGIITGLFLVGMVGFANAELIQNGTFDTDLSYWDNDGNNQVVSGIAQVGAPSAGDASYISQLFTIAPSTDAVNISFNYLWKENENTQMEDTFTATFAYLDNFSQWNSYELVNESNKTGSFSSTKYFMALNYSQPKFNMV